jgi:hypothetical protein
VSRCLILHISVVAYLAIILLTISNTHANVESSNPGAFPANSKPYGLSYGDWSVKWWQWLLPITSSMNPINDKTGATCTQGQSGPVWFLTGSLGGHAERSCTIPAGKAIFFPILSAECSYAEDSTLKNEAQLSSCAVNSVQGGIGHVTVDGVDFQNLQTYEVQSPLFGFTFPKDNIFGANPGPTQSVSYGNFLMLQPMNPGNHTVHFGGVVLANPTLGTQSFATDATYHLVVK